MALTIQENISITFGRGEAIAHNLEKMIGKQDLSPDLPDLINRFGAICLDVESGPEIRGLIGFRPKSLTLTEPGGRHEEEHPFDDLNGQIIKGVSDRCQLPINLVRKHPISALDQFVAEKPIAQVGLITFLNAFPDNQTPPYLSALAKSAAPLLVDGGQLVISTIENDIYTVERLEKSQKLVETYAQGLSSKFLEKDYGCAGRLFIICQK